MIPLHFLQTSSLPTMIPQDSPRAGTDSGDFLASSGACGQLDRHPAEQAPAGQTNLSAQSLLPCLEQIGRQLDTLNADLLGSLDRRQLYEAECLQHNALKLLLEGADGPLRATDGSDGSRLAIQMQRELQGHPASGLMERGWVLLDYIGDVLDNDFRILSGNAARRAGNIIAVAARTGTIVALTTVLRQMVGFALERYFQGLDTHLAQHSRMIAGLASLLIGPGLNLAGAFRDERNGTATATSRASRVGMMLLSVGGMLIASSYDPGRIIGATMGSIGPQMAFYTLTRDFVQAFFPLHENGGMNLSGLACSSVMYGIAQSLLSEGLVHLAPQSGAEYLVSEAARLATPMADWAAAAGVALSMLEPDILHDLLRSAMNTAVEVFDELQRPSWMRYLADPADDAPDRQDDISPADGDATSGERETLFAPKAGVEREGVRIGLNRPRLGAGNWPTSAELADNMLTTCAMRTSVFEAVVAIASTVAAALEKTSLTKTDQHHVVSVLIGALVMLGYPAFTGAHLTRRDKGEKASGDGKETPPPVFGKFSHEKWPRQ